MNLLIKPCLQFISLVVAVLLLSVWLDQGGIAYAGHFPWDQGHDTFTPNPGNPPGPGPGCNNCDDSDPYTVMTGNFIYPAPRDLTIPMPALGLAFIIERTFNSRDMRSGPLGYGWIYNYDTRLIEVTDKNQEAIIWRRGNGTRERFNKNPDGTYIHPGNLSMALVRQGDGSFLLTTKTGTQYRFNAKGYLEALVSRTAQVMSFAYDDTDFLTTITGPGGRPLRLEKGPNGKISRIVDPGGRQFLYSYDAAGNLTGFTDPAGQITSYTYDANHRLISVRDPRGTEVQRLSYDSQGRVASLLQDGERLTISYVPSQKKTERRDSSNRLWSFFYNDNGNIIKIVYPYGVTDEFLYDANYLLVGFKRNGNIIWQITYDAQGNPAAVTRGGQTVRYAYTPDYNNLASFTDANGNKTEYTYNQAGDLIEIKDASGRISRLEYDDKQRLTRMIDPLGGAMQFSYDNFGDPIRIVDQEGNVTAMTYDELGQMTAKTDAKGNTTQYLYDLMGRVTRATDALSGTLNLSYDADGNLVSATNANGATWTYSYDGFNRLLSIRNPLGNTVSFGYDIRGNMTSRTDALGAVTTYTYDSVDRLSRKTYPGGSAITFSYDVMNNLTGYSDSNSSASYGYDAIGHLTSARITVGGVSKTVQYAYGPAGELLSMTDPEGGATTYRYDPTYRLLALTNPSNQTISYRYDGAGAMIGKTLPNNVTTSYTRDAAERLKILTHQLDGTLLERFSYNYDPVGNITSITALSGAHQYVYDALHRLTQATHPTLPAERYTYDAVGNRLTSADFTDWNYNAANRLLNYDSTSFSHDANGNRTSKTDSTGVTTYQYDYENRLIRTTLPDGTVITYTYDPFGKRLRKTVGSNSTLYVYDTYSGTSVLLAEYNSQGARQVRYTTNMLDPLIMEVGGSSYYYHTDHLGTPVKLTNAAGQVVWEAKYSAFGEATLADTNSVTNNHRFPGQYADSKTGLYYNLARYYDPTTGRYTTSDPAVEAVSPLFTQIQNQNAYAYVNNNPVNDMDPQGTSVILFCSLGLPVCSAAIFCSANVGACSAGLICSGNVGACSAGLLCSGTAGGACSGGVVCSGQATPLGACSGAVLCSGQTSTAAACSGSIHGCSGQVGYYGVGACSANLAGACSGQAAIVGGSACSAQVAGACSGQVGLGGAVCSGQFAGACSAQAGMGYSGCSIQVGGACSAQTPWPGRNDCSGQASKCPSNAQLEKPAGEGTLFAGLFKGSDQADGELDEGQMMLAACNATPGAYAASPKAVSGLSTDRLGSGEVEIRLTTYGYQGYDLYRYQPDSETWEKVKAGSLQDSQMTKVLDKPSTGEQKATYKIKLKDRAGQTDEIGPFDVALTEPGQEHQPAPKQGVLGLLDLLFNQIFGRKAWAF